jgi:hypothetical protein
MPRSGRPRDRMSSYRWSTFVRSHAGAMLGCDFFVTLTLTFRTLYVFVVLEVGTRRIVHWNVTEQPTAEWTVAVSRCVPPVQRTDSASTACNRDAIASHTDRGRGAASVRLTGAPRPDTCGR